MPVDTGFVGAGDTLTADYLTLTHRICIRLSGEVVGFCGQKFPQVADYLEESFDELLAFTTAPKPV